jgi:hypothetical protein
MLLENPKIPKPKIQILARRLSILPALKVERTFDIAQEDDHGSIICFLQPEATRKPTETCKIFDSRDDLTSRENRSSFSYIHS